MLLFFQAQAFQHSFQSNQLYKKKHKNIKITQIEDELAFQGFQRPRIWKILEIKFKKILFVHRQPFLNLIHE